MAVDLADFIPTLKREVQPLGTDLYPTVLDDAWLGYLTDAFWMAKLEGFFGNYTLDDTEVVPIDPGAEDLPLTGVAVMILYASITILTNRILNSPTMIRAQAGPVEFEQQNSANVLTEMLKQMRATKDKILAELAASQNQTGVWVLDAYSTRIFSLQSYYGSPELTG
jgi:hypothetical protein